jgi:hypothetical protein
MKGFLPTTPLALTLALLAVSCDKIAPVQPPQPKLEPGATAPESPVSQDGERSRFTQAAQKELDHLRELVAELKSRAEAASSDSKARLAEEARKLEAQVGEAQQHLAALKEATADSWGRMKETFILSLERLKNAVNSSRKTDA